MSVTALHRSKSLPPVSVIVCAYNAEKDIRDTLDSLISQTYRNIEILIVDDASTDRTSLICQSYAEKDARVRIFRHDKNLGLAHGRNTGVEQSSHELLTFIDADDIALPEMIEKLVERLLSDHAILGVSAYSIYFNDNRDLGIQKIGPTCKEDFFKLFSGNKLVFLSNPSLVQKSDLAAAGGYRTDILRNTQGIRHADFCEDLDLWCRMSDLGEKGRYFISLKEPLSKYRKPLDSMSTKNLKHMQNKMRWIKDCLVRRRSGLPEQEYGTFLSSQPIGKKLNNAREDFAALFYKKAGFAYSKRSLFRLVIFLGLAGLASPKLVRQKLRTQTMTQRRMSR